MEYRRLGRTGLNVSMLSLGSGGPNRFGQSRYTPRNGILRLVRHALELGINFFDTASSYGQSESMLGKALQGIPRDSYYVYQGASQETRRTIIAAGASIFLVETRISGSVKALSFSAETSSGSALSFSISSSLFSEA